MSPTPVNSSPTNASPVHGGFVSTPHDDFATEPAPGLPGALPQGEKLLWQGSPDWRSLALRAFHIRKVAIYFGVLMLWRGYSMKADGASAADALWYALGLAPMAAICLAILGGLAYAYARMTIYTITSRRVLMRSGVALPITVNLPFKRIDAAGLKLHADGTGDVAIELAKGDRIAILAIWPNMRPWRMSRPAPMLRSLPKPQQAADVLAAALSGARLPTIRAEAALLSAGDCAGVSANLRPAH